MDLNIMQALFRLLFEAFNPLFFDFFSLLLSLSGFQRNRGGLELIFFVLEVGYCLRFC